MEEMEDSPKHCRFNKKLADGTPVLLTLEM